MPVEPGKPREGTTNEIIGVFGPGYPVSAVPAIPAAEH